MDHIHGDYFAPPYVQYKRSNFDQMMNRNWVPQCVVESYKSCTPDSQRCTTSKDCCQGSQCFANNVYYSECRPEFKCSVPGLSPPPFAPCNAKGSEPIAPEDGSTSCCGFNPQSGLQQVCDKDLLGIHGESIKYNVCVDVPSKSLKNACALITCDDLAQIGGIQEHTVNGKIPMCDLQTPNTESFCQLPESQKCEDLPHEGYRGYQDATIDNQAGAMWQLSPSGVVLAGLNDSPQTVGCRVSVDNFTNCNKVCMRKAF